MAFKRATTSSLGGVGRAFSCINFSAAFTFSGVRIAVVVLFVPVDNLKAFLAMCRNLLMIK
jgi:hypothetical protein